MDERSNIHTNVKYGNDIQIQMRQGAIARKANQ